MSYQRRKKLHRSGHSTNRYPFDPDLSNSKVAPLSFHVNFRLWALFKTFSVNPYTYPYTRIRRFYWFHSHFCCSIRFKLKKEVKGYQLSYTHVPKSPAWIIEAFYEYFDIRYICVCKGLLQGWKNALSCCWLDKVYFVNAAYCWRNIKCILHLLLQYLYDVFFCERKKKCFGLL